MTQNRGRILRNKLRKTKKYPYSRDYTIDHNENEDEN